MSAAEVISDVPQEDAAALNVSPFEGPEKLLEIWFAPSEVDVIAQDDVVDEQGIKRSGLRRVSRDAWEEMLDIVRCKVLSVIHGTEIDAYLLSESSLFIQPHKLILKTCGTTLNLLGLPRILEIAAACPHKLPIVHRLFYSRKSFMFPERQQGPHREWRSEVDFLDKLFGSGHEKGTRGIGSAYTVGSVNRDHWVLYLTGPGEDLRNEIPREEHFLKVAESRPLESRSPSKTPAPLPDFTLEILMSKLSATARRPFFFPATTDDIDLTAHASPHHAIGQAISRKIGVTSLFPEALTTLDAFAFEPCGYSANGLVKHDTGEGYYTIHVTPEEGWSYASFECNIPVSIICATRSSPGDNTQLPDLEQLVQRIVKIFQPGHLTATLFVAAADVPDDSPVEATQKTFARALTDKSSGFKYKRVDKINYEFCGYELAFASFEKKYGWEHQADWSVAVEPSSA